MGVEQIHQFQLSRSVASRQCSTVSLIGRFLSIVTDQHYVNPGSVQFSVIGNLKKNGFQLMLKKMLWHINNI